MALHRSTFICRLARFTIPAGCIQIGAGCLDGCTGLTDHVTHHGEIIKGINRPIPSTGVSRIGGAAFHDCLELTTIMLPPSISVIKGFAFKG